ncbi:glycosyltransferase family 39 protein [Acetomicrobium sp. S15 = DSM 107314]|uniref:glycosyltransferase family 39 protein n=1 Tax=Acetomicrobium sp. S15 = DSM 107314 TaxID=2529858 RepID=UPI0018E176B9|nr:glycosyltransferase family 39 protein [Acetomicrobium sp. S15 = DSM 107314]
MIKGGSVRGGVYASVVGISGMVFDFLLFWAAFSLGFPPGQAHVVSFIPAAFLNFYNAKAAFGRGQFHLSPRRECVAFFAVAGAALFLRGGVLATAACSWEWPPLAAVTLAIAVSAAVTYLGSAFFVFPVTSLRRSEKVYWGMVTVLVVSYAALLRLFFMGTMELIPQEAYYWNYAQHLDIGYLDHPPMVAWIIALFTGIFGHTEFFVRIGAFLSWVIAAFFIYGLARNCFEKSVAWPALLLFSTIPFFFGIGMIMTPDAPLVTFWAGTLYFLERALLGEERAAWWGVGICAGLGLLSKYTIALLGAGTLLFMLVDPISRKKLLSVRPYLALLIAFAIFSPAIIWNAQHNWISFSFQGPRRLLGPTRFSLLDTVAYLLLLLSPTGVAAAVAAISPKTMASLGRRKFLFLTLTALFPVAVFTLFSLFREVKLNWTGPAWLSLIPIMAWHMVSGEGKLVAFLRRAWFPTIAVVLLVFGFALHYATLGFPILAYPKNAPMVGWEDLARQVEGLEDQWEKALGEEPLIVGMDKHKVTSELAFYRTKLFGKNDSEREGVAYTAGPNLVGEESLIYKQWFPETKGLQGYARAVLFVGRSPEGLPLQELTEDGWRVEETGRIVARDYGIPLAEFDYVLMRKTSGASASNFKSP